MRKILLFAILVALFACQKSNQFVELPSVIGDGMVLQQNTDVSLWGKSSPKAKLEIRSSWGERTTAKTDEHGNWLAKIKTPAAGGPYELVFQTSDTSIVLKNVLIGEVWFCSGQSNMEMPLIGWMPDTIENWAAEIKAANYPNIRLFTVPKNATPAPTVECDSKWLECNPENITNFSATAYFFGRMLHQDLNVPIGLIHSSWGGTPAESWVSKEYLSDFPNYRSFIESMDSITNDFDSLVNWMEILSAVSIPKDTESYESVILDDFDYSKPEYDDSKWMSMELPALWETKDLPDYDGIVWYRKEFELPANLVGKDLILHLGAIDDMDITYINGAKVGAYLKPGFWKISRDYKVPASILKAGKNVIAVKVIDTQGGGGIYEKGNLTIGLKGSAGKQISLNGNWKYLPVAEMLKGKLFLYGKESNTYSDRPKLSGRISAYSPSTLYNGMINPVVPYTIKGVIWYQGESNVGRGYEYRTLFPALIKCWRNAWQEGDFPFYYVQIAPWNYSEEERSTSAEVREAQLLTLSMPNTGMIVTTDIGNIKNIHPSNKQDIGMRLALWALAKTYGKDSLIFSGPIYDSLSIEGSKAIVHSKYAESGLIAKNGPLTYFEIAGSDSVYYPAMAEINGQTVEVSSSKVEKPFAVRFGWDQIAEPNLFNGAGLPASPFRTDNWKRLSQ